MGLAAPRGISTTGPSRPKTAARRAFSNRGSGRGVAPYPEPGPSAGTAAICRTLISAIYSRVNRLSGAGVGNERPLKGSAPALKASF